MATDGILPLEKWQNLFSKYTLAEVRVLRKEFESESLHKKLELRSLIATRYPDLIHIAGEIIKMDGLVNTEDEQLARLCGSARPLMERNRVKSFGRKPATDIETSAVQALLKSLNLTLRHELNSRSNWSLLGRSLVLAESLGGAVAHHRRDLEQLVRQVVLHGELGDDMDQLRDLSVLICYMIIMKKDPSSLLEDLSESRPLAVSQIISQNTTESLLRALKLCSFSLHLVQAAFSKNQVHRLVIQQSENSTLLSSPEILDSATTNIGKYQPWLPESVKTYPSFPTQCTRSITNKGRQNAESQAFYDARYSMLSRSCVDSLSQASNGVLSKVSTLPDLIILLKQILEIFRDSANLRELREATDKNWLSFAFIPRWVQRGKQIMNDEISKVEIVRSLMLEKAAHNKANKLNGGTQSLDSVFSPQSVFGLSRYALNDLQAVFNSLDNVIQGKTGSAQTVMNAIDTWKQAVEKSRDSIEEGNRLKNIIAVSENYDEDWRAELEGCIDNACDELRKEEVTALNKTQNEFTNFLLEQSKSSRDTHGYVLLLRTQLHMRKVIEGLTLVNSRPKYSEKLLDVCYDGIAQELCTMIGTIYTAPLSMTTWVDGRPVTPSLDILSSLTRLVEQIVQNVGTDELIYSYGPGIEHLTKKVAEGYFGALSEEARKGNLLNGSDTEVGNHEEQSEEKQDDEEQDGKQHDDEKHPEGNHDNEKHNDEKPNSEDRNEENAITVSEKTTTIDCQLQIAMDTLFLSFLFNLPAPSLQVSTDDLTLLSQRAQEAVLRTRLLYHPFARFAGNTAPNS
jgi:Vps51/Vps67